MNKNDRDYVVHKIRSQYIEKEHTPLDSLKKLDAKVKRPAYIFAYVFGCISAIIMGAGMSLVMTDIGKFVGIGDPMLYGVLIGIVGMVLALINYPIYKTILNGRKNKYADRIMELSQSILNR